MKRTQKQAKVDFKHIKGVSITFAPVNTIFPDTNTNNTILGACIRYIRPGNSSGSYYHIIEYENKTMSTYVNGKRGEKEGPRKKTLPASSPPPKKK
jgi:hypothetical protein